MEGISHDRSEKLIARYQNFLKVIDKPNVTPVKVFDDLSPKSVAELELIREVSKDLQKKKEEDRLAQLAKMNAVEVKPEVAEVPKADAEVPQEA